MPRPTLPLLACCVLLAGCGGRDRGYRLLRVLEVAGRQGVAADGEHYYVSGSTALYVYSKRGELLLANEAPFEKLEPPANHIGDISVHAGELHAGIEQFEDGRGLNLQIAVYDAATLSYLRTIPWEERSGQVEISAVAVDAASGVIWTADWVDGRYVYRYDLATGKYCVKLHLRPVPQWQQGLAAYDGLLYLTADDGDAELEIADDLWRVRVEAGEVSAYVEHVKAFDEFRRAGEIEGLDFDAAAGELVVLSNRGKRIVLGMPQGLYPGYDKEIHELYVYALPGGR